MQILVQTFLGTCFCINVVNTFDNDKDNIIASPPIANIQLKHNSLLYKSKVDITITPAIIGKYNVPFHRKHIRHFTLIQNPPNIIPKTQTPSTSPYISEESPKNTFIKYGATIDNIGTKKILHKA